MCKKKVDQDESRSVQTNNLGLVNLESNSAGGPGVFEIVAMVLLVLCVLLTCHYCNRRFRKRRQRELHDAVQGDCRAMLDSEQFLEQHVDQCLEFRWLLSVILE